MTRPLVLDTNVVLDLFVFEDKTVAALKDQLDGGSVQWMATGAMRDELARVLGYPNIVAWLERRGRDPSQAAADVLARFDRSAQLVDTAPPAPLSCSDPHDQPFIDLAVAHGAELLSKDRAVSNVLRRLALRGAAG